MHCLADLIYLIYLICLICLIYLIYLICLICLICLIYLIYLICLICLMCEHSIGTFCLICLMCEHSIGTYVRRATLVQLPSVTPRNMSLVGEEGESPYSELGSRTPPYHAPTPRAPISGGEMSRAPSIFV